MAVTKIKPVKSTLSKALDYIENPDKTDGKMLISSFGCSYETADIEFGYTLSQALDKGSNLAFHLIQSFAPGEVDYEKAHEIGKQLADAVTKGQHMDRLTGLLAEADFERIYQRVKMDRTSLEEKLKELESQKESPVSTEDRARELVQQFLDSAYTSRELLVSLIERVELTENKQIIIRFRFRELEAIS